MTPPFYTQIQYGFLVITLILLVFSLHDLRYGLFAYFIIKLFRIGEVFPAFGAIRFELLAGLFIGILLFVKNRIVFANPEYHSISKAMFLFFAVVCLSVIQSYDIAHSYDYAYRIFFITFIFYVMFICSMQNIYDLKLFLYLYLILTVWLAYLPIYNYFLGIGPERIDAGIINARGETGGVAGHVALANKMIETIPFAYFMLLIEKNRVKKVFLILSIFVFIAATIASGSRGGFLGLVLCGVLILYKTKNRKFALFILTTSFMLITIMASDNYFHWMSTIFDLGGSDVSASSRITGLKHGIEMAIRRPLLGVGIGCYALARSAWFGWGIWAHNLYGELIGELGIIGTIVWGWLIFLFFKEIKRMKRFIADGNSMDPFLNAILDACWVALVLRLIIGFTTHSLLATIWYLIAGLLVVSYKAILDKYSYYDKTIN